MQCLLELQNISVGSGNGNNTTWFFSFTFDGVRLKRWVPCTTNTINTSLIGVCWKHTMLRSVMSTMGKTRCLNLGSFGTITSQLIGSGVRMHFCI